MIMVKIEFNFHLARILAATKRQHPRRKIRMARMAKPMPSRRKTEVGAPARVTLLP